MERNRPPQLEDQLLRQQRNLLALQAAAAAINASFSTDMIAQTFNWETCGLLASAGCAVFLLDDATESVSLLDVHLDDGGTSIRLPEADINVNNYPLIRKVIDEKTSVQLTSNWARRQLPEQVLMERSGISALLLVPFIFHEKVFGFACIMESNGPRTFSDQEISLALLLSQQASVAYMNADLYQKIVETNAQLEASNEELDSFAHTVAHDLKNPLGVMLGFADTLLYYSGTFSEAEKQEFLELIVNSGHKMESIIESLLMLASVRKQSVESVPLDMNHILSEVRGRLNTRLFEFEGELIIPYDLPSSLGFGPWVEEVWVNYISNAIKYGGRPPRIEIGGELIANGMVRYWVRDNGAGLSPEDQEKLFTPFTRIGQASISGHGLGLSIVRRIVNRLDGTVGVESKPDEGSCFYFTLPAAANASN